MDSNCSAGTEKNGESYHFVTKHIYLLKFAREAIRVNKENARVAKGAHEDRKEKKEPEAKRKEENRRKEAEEKANRIKVKVQELREKLQRVGANEMWSFQEGSGVLCQSLTDLLLTISYTPLGGVGLFFLYHSSLFGGWLILRNLMQQMKSIYKRKIDSLGDGRPMG